MKPDYKVGDRVWFNDPPIKFIGVILQVVTRHPGPNEHYEYVVDNQGNGYSHGIFFASEIMLYTPVNDVLKGML